MMVDKNQASAASAIAGTPIPSSTEKSDTQTNDQARRDGGKTGSDKSVTKEQIEQIAEQALDHTKDEPGS